MKNKVLMTLVLWLALILAFSSCSSGSADGVADSITIFADGQENQVVFVSQKEMKAWKKPLKNFLSDIDMENEPSLYAMALLDVNCDGIPEVLKVFSGGSAGNVGFVIFDLYSGDEMDYFQGGWYGNSKEGDWMTYLNAGERTLSVIGQYNQRYGAPESTQFTVRLSLPSEPDADGKFICDQTIATVTEYIRQVSGGTDQNGYPVTDFIKAVAYIFRGEEVQEDDFNDRMHALWQDNVRVPGTEPIIVRWSACPGDTQAERAAQMAEALLTTGQRFVKEVRYPGSQS